jgi:phage-related minor tail protein
MADDTDLAAANAAAAAAAEKADQEMQKLEQRQRDLALGANKFASAMTSAFSQMIIGGKQFDDVLKSLALRMSDMVLRAALQPVMKSLASSLTGGLEKAFGNLFGSATGMQVAAQGAVKPFASGGVIGTPTYFPLTSGGVGLAGEAGPEAILPLARGRDGRLGVAGGSGGAQVTIQIMTPDADSFRRSEVYLAGQIARAVARGQRDL